MPVFEKPPLETLVSAKDRWTPLYLEHGRLEVDDSSIKWIGADHTVFRIPVATLSAIMLGPGTTVTHAAMKTCSQSNTPVCWVGAEGMHFYSSGAAPTSNSDRAIKQSGMHSHRNKRTQVARRMFVMRFKDEALVREKTIAEMRGLEGQRVRALYQEMGQRYGVTWKGRSYDQNRWECADNINRAVSAGNAALYALTTAVICSLGYLPQLGFVHTKGMLAFVYDMADIYKPSTTLPAAFETLSINPDATEDQVITRLKTFIEKSQLLKNMPKDIERLLA